MLFLILHVFCYQTTYCVGQTDLGALWWAWKTQVHWFPSGWGEYLRDSWCGITSGSSQKLVRSVFGDRWDWDFGCKKALIFDDNNCWLLCIICIVCVVIWYDIVRMCCISVIIGVNVGLRRESRSGWGLSKMIMKKKDAMMMRRMMIRRKAEAEDQLEFEAGDWLVWRLIGVMNIEY